MAARTYSTDAYLTAPAPTANAPRSASRCASSEVSHGSPRQPVSKSGTSWCPDATTGNRKATRTGQIGAREEASGGLSGTAMGRLDCRRKSAADDVQMVAERWSSPKPPTPAAYVGRRTAQRPWRTCPRHPAVVRAIQPCSPVGRPQLPGPKPSSAKAASE
jgi:hypothetical protein